MSNRQTKVPAPYTVTTPDPGAKPNADGTVSAGAAFVAWLQADRDFKASQPVADYHTGSGSGINSN